MAGDTETAFGYCSGMPLLSQNSSAMRIRSKKVSAACRILDDVLDLFPSSGSGASSCLPPYKDPLFRCSSLSASPRRSSPRHRCCPGPCVIPFTYLSNSQPAEEHLILGISHSESLPLSRVFQPAICVPRVGPWPTRSGPPDCTSIWRGRQSLSLVTVQECRSCPGIPRP